MLDFDLVHDLTVAQSARVTGYTEAQIRAAIASERLPVKRIGSRIFIAAEDLKRFVAADQLVK